MLAAHPLQSRSQRTPTGAATLPSPVGDFFRLSVFSRGRCGRAGRLMQGAAAFLALIALPGVAGAVPLTLHKLADFPKFAVAYSGKVLTKADGTRWVIYAPAGLIWQVDASDTVLDSGDIRLDAKPPIIRWADHRIEPLSLPWAFRSAGTTIPLVTLYDAFLGHPLRHAVGPLAAGDVLDPDETVHAAKGAAPLKIATVWASRGPVLLISGAKGRHLVSVAKLAAAARGP